MNPKPQLPYSLFDIELKERTLLSPNMARLTFSIIGDRPMATAAADQRVKLFFPYPDGKPSDLPLDDTWQQAYARLPNDNRPARRTYTIRYLRDGEVDIDFVLHGDEGPASRWATHALPGNRLQIAAPNGQFEHDFGGYEWRCPADVTKVLLIGDETALPAVAGILDELNAREDRPETHAIIEVPHKDDQIEVSLFPELNVTWLVRNGASSAGDQMISAARDAKLPDGLDRFIGMQLNQETDAEVLWDRATGSDDGFYCWVAGETGAVRKIRKILLKEKGQPKSSANLMGYWRKGISLDDN